MSFYTDKTHGVKKLKIEEISTGEAFLRCRPASYVVREEERKRYIETKVIDCAQCKKTIKKVIVVNDRIGLCACCGARTFDWRGSGKIGTPLDYDDETLAKAVVSILKESTFCCKCGKDITHENQVGAGDGTGQRFQCESCYKKK